MNTYRVIVRAEAHAPEHHTLYVEAESPGAARDVLTARGLDVAGVTMIDAIEVPDGAGVQRAPSAARRPSLLRDNAPARRVIFMLIGIGAGLLVVVGALFVFRAREHLTRSDIQPRVPAGMKQPGSGTAR